LLKFEDSTPVDRVFTQTFDAFMKKDVSSLTLFIPRAEAQALDRVRQAASAAGWEVLIFTTRVAKSAGGVAASALATIPYGLEWLKTAFMNSARGQARCGKNGEYMIDGYYKHYDKDAVYQRIKAIDEELKRSSSVPKESFEARTKSDLGTRSFNDARAKLASLREMFTLNAEKDIVISPEFAKKVFAPGPVLKCNQMNSAQAVKAAWLCPGDTPDEKIRCYHRRVDYVRAVETPAPHGTGGSKRVN
jgi:hypothetical protein